MTTPNENCAYTAQQVKEQEAELKELIFRVMQSPLQPLIEKTTQLEKCLQNVKDISQEIRDIDLPSFQADIRSQKDEVKELGKRLPKTILSNLEELLVTHFSVTQKELMQLLQGQASVRDLLSEVQQEQTKLQKTVTLSVDKTISSLDEGHEHLAKGIDALNASVRDGTEALHRLQNRVLWLSILFVVSGVGFLGLAASRIL